MHAEPHPSAGGSRDMHSLTTCPLCQANYNPLKTKIMAERDDAHLVYLECRQCGSAVLAVVTAGISGLTTVGAVTDLTSDEISRWPNSAPVDLNDVLDIYAMFERNDYQVLIDRREKE